MRIEKVFQIPKGSGQYEDIKIAVDGDSTLKILEDIYIALYLDTYIAHLIHDADTEEIKAKLKKVLAVIQLVEAEAGQDV